MIVARPKTLRKSKTYAILARFGGIQASQGRLVDHLSGRRPMRKRVARLERTGPNWLKSTPAYAPAERQFHAGKRTLLRCTVEVPDVLIFFC
jgi:hypothetical protein